MFDALVTFNLISKFCVPCGARLNDGGCTLTSTPSGEITEHEYVSDLLATFFTTRRTDGDPLRFDIVIDGRFRFVGEASEALHAAPVAARTTPGVRLGNEHKKPM